MTPNSSALEYAPPVSAIQSGAVISVRDLVHAYRDRTALAGVSFDVGAAELFGLLGPNGAGKTTTVRMLTSLIAPSSGRAFINGLELGKDDQKIRSTVGILTETPGMYERLSAEKNLTIFARLYRVKDVPGQVSKYLRMLGLWERRFDEVGSFSKGMRQKVGIAIGIGQFRESGMQRVKYAHQDADVMAKYWSVVGGVPAERIRRLFDSRALKSDLAETFEEWLPKQVDSTTVVYVFVSGRGVVEPTTGAVSVIPFDGTVTSGGRLYSLRRLQEALMKLPVQRAIVMIDLSLEHPPGIDGAGQAAPVWPQEEQGKERIMWMVGNRAVQETHYFDLGQHGLFTYQLLRGLSGAADVDKDGTILAGELCTYTKGQVLKMAREQFGNEQEPLCVPGPGQGATVRLQPVAKVK